MWEKKKRERVVAEITVAHLSEFAKVLGRSLSYEESVSFLNEEGRAYEMWKHMMHAGEEYIQSKLPRPRTSVLNRNVCAQARVSPAATSAPMIN